MVKPGESPVPKAGTPYSKLPLVLRVNLKDRLSFLVCGPLVREAVFRGPSVKLRAGNMSLGSVPSSHPRSPVLFRPDASLLMPANPLLRGSVEPAGCTSLTQVGTCALHRARAGVFGFSPRPVRGD